MDEVFTDLKTLPHFHESNAPRRLVFLALFFQVLPFLPEVVPLLHKELYISKISLTPLHALGM
jgi:hypothetical protein